MPVSLDPSDPPDPFDPLDRPSPGRRWLDRLTGRARPWIDWFGLRRMVAAAVTVVAVVGGGWWLLRTSPPPIEAGLPYATTGTATTVAGVVPGAGASGAPTPAAGVVPSATTTTAGVVVVYVTGAVTRPGVYDVAPGSRVHVAIEAAGGAAPGSDVGALNLAAPLTDGERVYVPQIGEIVPPAPAVAIPVPGSSPRGPVDLNRATAAELDALPGIGPATAQAIVTHREANGPFASVDDLEAVRGIGPAKLAAIRPLVTV